MLETKTADKPVSQVLPIPITKVYVNKAFNPMPGANAIGYFAIAIGYFAINPITIQAIPLLTAVAKNTPFIGIPVVASIDGLTLNMYTIAKKVVNPPTISLR